MKLKTMDDIFRHQLKKMFEFKEVSDFESFGQKYKILSQKNVVERLKGNIGRYIIDSTCEIIVFKTKGNLRQKLFNPEGDYEILRVVYCTNGQLNLTVYGENMQNTQSYNFKKDNMIVQIRSPKIVEYFLNGYDYECIIVEFYLDKIYENILNVMSEAQLNEWKNENVKVFKEGVYNNSNTTNEILNILNEIKSIEDLVSINKYIELKSKVLQLLPLVLKQQKEYKDVSDLNMSMTIEKIKTIIDESEVENIPKIKDLCEMFSISRYQIHSLFKKNQGIGIVDYIQKKKMEYSKNLLLNTNNTILQISSEIGYENPSKFSRRFKKYFGLLPSEFRKKEKN